METALRSESVTDAISVYSTFLPIEEYAVDSGGHLKTNRSCTEDFPGPPMSAIRPSVAILYLEPKKALKDKMDNKKEITCTNKNVTMTSTATDALFCQCNRYQQTCRIIAQAYTAPTDLQSVPTNSQNRYQPTWNRYQN